ncbi:MAG: hypothetical protein LBF22_06915 [Deltaproteobacteria bacterium]|nr:hypothetical protein [Deltaproteobacteria bacterium]
MIVFLPAGGIIIYSAFSLNQPHYFVMLIFSGSLMLLLGFSGVLGLLWKKPPNDNQEP